MLKRSFDILSSLFVLILFAPVLIGVGHLIRREDGGPIFYRGVRVGRQPPTQSYVVPGRTDDRGQMGNRI